MTLPSPYGTGQRTNTQTALYRPRTRVPNLRYMLVHAPRRGARMLSRGAVILFTVSVERVKSLNERLSHQRVVRVQRPNTQTPPYGPRIPFSEAPIRARPRTSTWREKALG